MYKYKCLNCETEYYKNKDYHELIFDDEQKCKYCSHYLVPEDLYKMLEENRDIINKYYPCLEDVIEDFHKLEYGEINEP